MTEENVVLSEDTGHDSDLPLALSCQQQQSASFKCR